MIMDVGAELTPVVKKITQEKINRYAEAGGDGNPLHTDPEFAARTMFGGTIAHGMLVLAYLSEMLTAAFGPAWAFLTGWAAFVLTFSAAAAAMATAAVQHLQRVLVPEGPASTRMASVVGALVVLALTAANTAGARLAGWVTAALTAVPRPSRRGSGRFSFSRSSQCCRIRSSTS